MLFRLAYIAIDILPPLKEPIYILNLLSGSSIDVVNIPSFDT